MTRDDIIAKLRRAVDTTLPLPGGGQTAFRHRLLIGIAQENLSIARLAEAHFDAVAILAEAGREPKAGALYGVWASEGPASHIHLMPLEGGFAVSGSKLFCSGAGLLDRALLTISTPERRLVDIDLRSADSIEFDDSVWKTNAFAETWTSKATFNAAPVAVDGLIGDPGWYLERPGFWHGACGPAACWAGGAMSLVDYAMRQSRNDPHTLAHLGAMQASVWALCSYLDSAGHEIDKDPNHVTKAQIRALAVRHLVEQACTDILRRLTRAYGPHPLAMDAEVGSRYQEVDLYLRQSHAERDLEVLGRECRLNQRKFTSR